MKLRLAFHSLVKANKGEKSVKKKYYIIPSPLLQPRGAPYGNAPQELVIRSTSRCEGDVSQRNARDEQIERGHRPETLLHLISPTPEQDGRLCGSSVKVACTGSWRGEGVRRGGKKGKERQGESQSVRLVSGKGTHHSRWTNIPRRTMIVTRHPYPKLS